MSKQHSCRLIGTTTLLFLFMSTSALAAQGMRAARTRAAGKNHRVREAGARQGAALLLGKRSVEPRARSLSAGRAEAFRLQATGTGLAQAANVYLTTANTSRYLIVGLYSEGDGQPGSLLSTGSALVSSRVSWIATSISPVEIHAGATYWLAILGTGGTLRYRDRRHGQCVSQTSAQKTLTALPSAWRRGRIYSNCPVSAYITAEASAPLTPPTNTALPAIGDAPVEGQTLDGNTGAWTGSPTAYAYQWEACDALGEGCLVVSGATSSRYKLGFGNVGGSMRVVVTASNTGGSTPAASEPTGTVAPAPPANTAPPSISGSAEEGRRLTASEGSWTGAPISYAYQWEDCNSSGEACTNVVGASGSSYTLGSSDVGHTVQVVVTATNAGGSTPAVSEATGAVAAAPPPAPTNTGAPAVSGTAEEGQTLASSTGTWTGSPTSYAYQWEACDALGEGCLAVSGATSSRYKLGSGNVGGAMRVVVTASNGGGSTPAASEATGTVVAALPAAPTDTVAPVVSGAAEEGQTLTTSTGTWTGSPTSFGYQWEDCNSSGEACASISGATSSGYKLGSSDVGHRLRVQVTATNAGGSGKAVSEATGTVVAALPAAPTDTVAPVVSGAAEEGQTLTTSTGTWTGSPTSFGYQWEDCNSSGEACASISGATSSGYKLGSSDVGHRLRVQVTATNAGGSGKAVSEATGTVVAALPAAPTDTVAPVVSGAAEEGQTLTTSTGTWTGSPTSFGYQWEDCNSSGEACASISGATSSGYKLGSSDVGHRLRVQVTATNAGGSGKAVSEATGTVVAALPAAPTDTVAPVVSGAAEEGQTLTTSTGTWTGSPTSFGYQWEDCNSSGEACASISGATSSGYKLGSSDVGHRLRVQVTATNAGGSGKAVSEATGTVVAALPAAPTDTVAPVVSGAAEEGQTLTTSTGTWTGSPTSFGYQWEDCNSSGEACASISGATSSGYKLGSSDVGHRLRVQVTATNAGGSGKAVSEATGTVVAALPAAPTDTVAPVVSGAAEEGQTLTTSTGTWTGSPTSFGYQWEDCNSSGEACASISGATSSGYKLGSSDVGHRLRVQVTATNAGGSGKAVSEATGTVVAALPAAPTDTVAPVVSGAAEEGQTLTTSTGTWTGSPTSFGYQWEDCNSSGEACASISGATSSGYKLGSSDVGHRLRVQVTATNAGGSGKAVSLASATVIEDPPSSVPDVEDAPVISGTAEEGETLSASTGTWTGSPTSYSYQWKEYVETTESFEPIEGATSSTYALGGLDSGHEIAVEVGATNSAGTTWAISSPTSSVKELSTANEWVSESGGSCTRYSTRHAYESSKACASINAAIKVASCGDVIEVEGGTYGDHEWEAGMGKGPGSRAEEHVVRENSNLDSCSTQVVVEPEAGRAVHINRLQVGGGRNGGDSPDWVAFKGLSIYEATNLMEEGEHVTVDEQQGAIFNVEGDKHVVIENSHFGPCETHEGTPGGEGTTEHPCIGDNHILGYNSTPTEYVAVRHNVIEHFIIYEGHYECLFLGGGKHLLIEGNKFHTCQLMGIFIQPRGNETGELEDVEIQDNSISQIQTASHPGPTEQRGTAISVGANSGTPINFLVRYNSLGEHESIETESGSIGGYYDVIGNLFDGTGTCQAGYTYAYNGWFSAHHCSSGEAEDLAVPYLDPSLATPNFALTSGSSPAKGLVRDAEAKDKIEWDYSGDRRSATGPWNAGSDE